jgi:fibronectin-binding autotransporter adhesin
VVRFQNSATAGSANVSVVANNGGTVLFTGASTGGGAQLNASPNASIDISGLTTAGMTAGVITDDAVGANFFRLGSKTLTVGGSNLDSTLTAVIADGGVAGGVGGSIVKVGTGMLTFAGSAANTYTGTTFVNQGILVLNKSAGVDAIRGPLVVGDGLDVSGSAVLWVAGVENIHNSQPVTVNGDGFFEVRSAPVETIGSLTVNKGYISLTSGSGLLLDGPLAMSGGTVGGPGLILFYNTTIQATSASDGTAATISAPVFLPPEGTTYTFTVSDGPGATDLIISGNITDAHGSSSIVKAGGGVMVLSGNKTFDGSTRINAGTLSISSDANLGAPPASPTANHLVFDGGTLRVTGFLTLNANRGMTLTAGGGTVEVAVGSTLTYAGVPAGAGSLTKTGPGILLFHGASANTYTGTTTVNDGTLALNRSSVSIAGPLVIGDGLGAANSAGVSLESAMDNDQISDAAPVTILSDGRLRGFDNTNEVIGGLTVHRGNVQIGANGSLSMTGALAMTGGTISGGAVNVHDVTASSDAGGQAATITTAVNLGFETRTFTVNDGPAAVDLHIGGFVSIGGITKTGAGTLAIAGGSNYSGPTTVIAGKLIVTGSISGSTTVVANSATLQGTGATGPLTINSGGALVPGLSVGTLATGNLTLAAGSTSSFELAVAGVAGSGVNDLVAVNGNLVLGGTLAITTLPGFGPGAYPLFTYTNTATNQGLAFESSFLAAHPGSTITLDMINKRVIANITAAPLLAADFDEDGDVDGMDLTRWRNNFATGATHMQGNADADGDVDGADFLVWQRQLGGSPAAPSSTAIPEPASLWLAMVSIASLIATSRRGSPAPTEVTSCAFREHRSFRRK